MLIPADFFNELVGIEILQDPAKLEDYSHDESLTLTKKPPKAVIFPKSESDVVTIAKAANKFKVPLTPRGAGSGMSGAAAPVDSVVVSFEKMNKILEVDAFNQVAVVEPGVRLSDLEEQLATYNLIYPVYPGELSATIGGNISTNAGGMRAIKYGVTRHHVLGLEVVLINGDKLVTGGKFYKSSVGYDLTQLFIGSEGTLGLITKAVIKLSPKPSYTQAILAAFKDLEKLSQAIPEILLNHINPAVCEYIDNLTLEAIASSNNVELGISEKTKSVCSAYLLLFIESDSQNHLDELIERAGMLLEKCGVFDTFVLSPSQSSSIISAREKAFFVAKAVGANDIIDVAVPRSEMANYLKAVSRIAKNHNVLIPGCGHIGDGNVHLALFAQDEDLREIVMEEVLKEGLNKGGAISGEHGIGTEKRKYFLKLEQPKRIELLKSIKHVFDPEGLLNPGHLI